MTRLTSIVNLPEKFQYLNELELPLMVYHGLQTYGTVEARGTRNSPVIMNWADFTGLRGQGYSADSVPWCGLWMAYVAKLAGKQVVDGPLWALNWGKFGQPGGQPELGDILTFQRPGGGHVALYIAEDSDHYYVLGGNQSDAVNIMRIEKSRMKACRQPPYINKPSSARPYIVRPGGVVSRNEA